MDEIEDQKKVDIITRDGSTQVLIVNSGYSTNDLVIILEALNPSEAHSRFIQEWISGRVTQFDEMPF